MTSQELAHETSRLRLRRRSFLLPIDLLLLTFLSHATLHAVLATSEPVPVPGVRRSVIDDVSHGVVVGHHGRQLKSAQSCFQSPLFGYAFATELGRSLILHWKPQVGRVMEFALQARALTGAEKGWVAVGWSQTGDMVPADAVVGNVDGYSGPVMPFYLTGNNAAGVNPTTFSIGETSFETVELGSTVVKFSRRVDDGSVRVNPSGTNKLIWAHSASRSKAMEYHSTQRGSAFVDFACSSMQGSSAPQAVIKSAAISALSLTLVVIAGVFFL